MGNYSKCRLFKFNSAHDVSYGLPELLLDGHIFQDSTVTYFKTES